MAESDSDEDNWIQPHAETLTKILSKSQQFMREQKVCCEYATNFYDFLAGILFDCKILRLKNDN